MPRHDRFWLEDILGAIEAVKGFVAGITFDAFVADDRTQSAVLQKLTIIGEAAARMPEGIRDRYPEIDWRAMIGFRNRAVHAYFGINWSTVWDTATVNVPKLEAKIREVLLQEFPDPEEGAP